MNPMTTNPLIWPTLRYNDARAAIVWLVDMLGFEETAVYGEGDRVDHAQLNRPGGGGVMLGSVRDDGPISVPAGVGSIYLVIDTDDELSRIYDRVRAVDTVVPRELRTEDYGGSGFVCRDPEGVYWSLGTYRGE
ncbi:VOC family protein [Rhodococcus sp. SBT000017]|uniref:VOC family protein n=1 Tax=Rhodococcus sp. SBT000017 TaxID=1803385 RepID=UPI001604FAE6